MSTRDPDASTSAQVWDAHATEYARLFAPLTGQIARSMFSMAQSRSPAAPRLLDIACGPGDLAVAAAKYCADRVAGFVPTVDISPAMIALTERALAPIDADVRCEVRDGQALGLEDGSFDAAFSYLRIFLFPDRRSSCQRRTRYGAGWSKTQ